MQLVGDQVHQCICITFLLAEKQMALERKESTLMWTWWSRFIRFTANWSFTGRISSFICPLVITLLCYVGGGRWTPHFVDDVRGTWRIPFLPLVERQNKLTHLDISQRWIGVVWTIQHTINSELNGLFTEQVVFNKITIFFLQLAENGFANAFSLSYLYLRWRPVATNDWHPHRIRSIYITPILNWTGIFKFYI